MAVALSLAAPAVAQCSALFLSPPGTDLHLGDDDVRTVGLGFAFPFDGLTYSTISVAANGFVWLGTVTPAQYLFIAGDYADSEASLLQWEPRIAVCWDDWNPASPQLQPGGGVFFRGGASSASIVWKGVPAYNNGSPPTAFANMELVLDASGAFYIRYASTMGVTTGDCIVGCSSGRGIAPAQYDWTLSVPGSFAGGTAYELFAGGAFNLANRTLAFLPANSQATTHLVVNSAMSQCEPVALPPLAITPTSFGNGCPPVQGSNTSSIHELFTPSSGATPDDLSGQSITFVRAGSVYIATPGPGFDNSYLINGQLLPQEDETIARGLSVGAMGSFPFANIAVNAIDAAANGYLLLQPGGGSQWLPNAVDFLAGPPRIAPHWSDYDLFGGGRFFWSNNDPSFCMATWESAPEFALPGVTSTFQCKLASNGDITFSYGQVASAADDVLVGFTLGHGAQDPGAVDMSSLATNTFVHDLGALVLPLRHEVSGPASIGTMFTLLAKDLPGGSPFGVFAIGATPLQADLTTVGMPGCQLYVSLDELLYELAVGAELQQSFTIPGTASLWGVTVHTQAAVLAPLNAFGLITSNRMSFTLGR